MPTGSNCKDVVIVKEQHLRSLGTHVTALTGQGHRPRARIEQAQGLVFAGACDQSTLRVPRDTLDHLRV